MLEIALTILARQKYDATVNFGAAIPVGTTIGSEAPDQERLGQHHSGKVPLMGHSSHLFQ